MARLWPRSVVWAATGSLCWGVKRRELLGEQHPDTLVAMNNLAQTLEAQGDLARARQLQEQVVAASRELLGEQHPSTLTAMNNLAQVGQELEGGLSFGQLLRR